MSGCLIVQLKYEPIKEENRLSEDEFLCDDCGYTGNGFLSSVGDYIYEVEDYQQNVRWFLDIVGDGVSYNEEENSITIVSKSKLFKRDYDEFIDLTKNLTIEEFMNSSYVFNLENLLNDKFGLYIYEEYWQESNSFFRDCEEGEKYYIGGILHYHC